MEDLNITVENGVKTVEVRTGEALKLKEPLKVEITGTINAPLEWLDSREKQIPPRNCHILVDEDKRTIALHLDESNPYKTVIVGQMKISSVFQKFGINSGEYRTPLEMSEFIKMNRVYFENRQKAMELVSQLRNFKAKVNKQVEQEVNLNKGDKRLILNQVVDSNVPETFKVSLPLFKGDPKVTFEVETYFNPTDLTCTLVSPEAEEIYTEIVESEINRMVNTLKEKHSEIVIVRV